MRLTCSLLLLALTACDADTSDHAAAASHTGVAPTATEVAPPDEPGELSVGSKAPPFALLGSDGNTHTLSDYAGQHVVVAFFPKAFTGG